MLNSKPFQRAACGLAALLALGAQAATIEIQSRDPVGVGFNDPTPVQPVGGNPGTTLGAQRMNVYRHVADLWAAQLTSDITITVSAGWEALNCDATGAVLGSAGAWNVWDSFPGAPKANTWYPQALANKLSGRSLTVHYGQEDDGSGYGNVDIKTQFNINLGKTDCLEGVTFYLGFDGKAGNNVNFVATLLHELGHGLGFALLTTRSSTGQRFLGLPSVWEDLMLDNTTGKTWLQMTDAERAASAINQGGLAWTGANAVAGVSQVLAAGRAPKVVIGGAAGPVAGVKQFGPAQFGPLIDNNVISGTIAKLTDQANGTGLACTALTPAASAAVAGKVALIDRGGCTFITKVRNLQNAGAKAVLVADNTVAGISPLGGGPDATITIPSGRILKVDGDAIKARLANRVRGQAAPVLSAGMSAPLTGLYAGTDASARPLLYTPLTLAPGSSVSHWDISASPNQLMEPFINADLTTVLTVPKDLTYPLLKDLGW